MHTWRIRLYIHGVYDYTYQAYTIIHTWRIQFYPAMTAFTDQYSFPNIFFYIGQL